jgi:selenocysteine lyase/cysteine desulfurase
MKMEMLLRGVHSCARATRGRSNSAAARSSDTARASPRAISTDDDVDALLRTFRQTRLFW